MTSLLARTHIVTAIVGILLTWSASRARAENGHLLPVAPAFDVEKPIGTSYSQVCEQMLFEKPDWLIRYYTATESVTTGLSITKDLHGRYHVWARQAQPQLGSVVAHAFYRKLDLKSVLTAVRVKKADAEIPPEVALPVQRFWLSLLSGVRPDERLTRNYVLSNLVILYARPADGRTLGGKFPPAGFKFKNLAIVEEIIDGLIDVCVAPEKDRPELFERIERRALMAAQK
jgi:hypothetical protein